jgi:signal transduction histidine kinase
MFPRLTILQKGLILIAVPLLFQVVFITLLIKMRADGALAVDWTIHTKDVIAQAQTSRVTLLVAHGAIQGYVMTHDPRFVGALESSVARAQGEIRELGRLVSDREDQTRAASKIDREAAEFFGYLRESQRFVDEGRMDPASAASRRRQSQSFLDVLNADYDRFVDFERDLDAIRQARMERSREALKGLLIGGFAASLLFTSLLAIAFSRNISGRIVSLAENTHRLAEGKELTPPISGADEIARLDRLFHEMAATLSESARREKKHSRLLERRAEELDGVNAQLREKAEENEMFVYSVSHDLRSPLVNLQGFSKELGMIGKDLARLVDSDEVPAETRRQARSMIDVEMAESIGFIQTAVSRLGGIIDGLLRLSRAGQVEYRSQKVDVGPVVARVVTALRGTIDARKATVKVGALPAAWGDPSAVEQVFANLIGNAVNYLDKDRPGKIDVFAVDPLETGGPVDGIAKGSVVYAVRDNGLGIADSYKAKVFAVFQRLHGDVAQGEGVGLALVRRVVERHGGRVWFESRVGEGTTFFVAFPSSEPRPAEATGESHYDLPVVVTTLGENGRSAEWQPSR